MAKKIIQALSFFSPHKYKEIIQYTLKELFVIWSIPAISFLVFFILAGTIVGMVNLGSANTDNFDQLDITINHSQKKPFYLMENPDIYIDLNTQNSTKANIQFLEEGITYKKYIWFGKTQVKYEDLKDAQSSKMQLFIKTLLILLVPGLVLLWIIMIVIKYIIIGVIFVLLGLLANKLFGQRGILKDQIKAYIAMTVIFMLFDFIIFPFYRMYLIPILIGFVFYIIVSLLIGKKEFSHKPKHSKKKAI